MYCEGNVPIKGHITVMRNRKQTYKIGIPAKDKVWRIFFCVHFSLLSIAKLHFHKTVKSTVEVVWYK